MAALNCKLIAMINPAMIIVDIAAFILIGLIP
jgi:hypothetical protein